MSIYHPISSLFEGEDQFALVTKLGDPLLKIDSRIDFEQFRSSLENVFPTKQNSKGGRPRMDPVLMFKVLLLQNLYALSDHAVEFQIADRMSFQRFLGIKSIKGIPDEKTIWLFREQAQSAGLIDRLFNEFVEVLRDTGLIANKGKIIDATIVEAPRQRNSRDVNKKIKSGERIEEWDSQPNKKRQKDVDASWTKKNGQTYFGYKDHIKVDSKSKLIEDYDVGTCSEHDSQVIDKITNEQTDGGQPCWADSAYSGEAIEMMLAEKNIKNQIHEKGTRNHPLNETQKKRNKQKSKTRVRVEHIFGYMHQSMGGIFVRTIGIERAATQIGLKNLFYNICRATYLLNHSRIGMSISKI